MSDLLYALARVALPVLFIVSGIGKFIYVVGVAGTFAASGFPQPTVFGYAAATVELVGGLLLVVGFKTRWAAIVLLLLTAGWTLILHNFWDMEGLARATNQTQALKNLSIMAALLLVAVIGAGRYSLDGRRG